MPRLRGCLHSYLHLVVIYLEAFGIVSIFRQLQLLPMSRLWRSIDYIYLHRPALVLWLVPARLALMACV